MDFRRHHRVHLMSLALAPLLLASQSMPAQTRADRATVQTVAEKSSGDSAAAASAAAVELTPASELPDSPGAVRFRGSDSSGSQVVFLAQSTEPAPASQSSNQEQPARAGQQPRQPAGAAAAESPVTNGIAASEPAGAAIAPAPQRKVHSLLIKIGAVAGAGIAIGTVLALSAASPSRPPGAH